MVQTQGHSAPRGGGCAHDPANLPAYQVFGGLAKSSEYLTILLPRLSTGEGSGSQSCFRTC